MSGDSRLLAAVVLAGGQGRRFGGDKLAADVDGRSLLERALEGLPEHAAVAVVGPERQVSRPVTFLREDPPGGGPGAGLVAGLRWALDSGADAIVTLPGDAPAGGRAALALLATLTGSATASATGAVVGVDGAGRSQVLLLALRPDAARRLIAAAGPGAGHGQPARWLVDALTPPAHRQPLPDELCEDIDTGDQLRHFRNPNRA